MAPFGKSKKSPAELVKVLREAVDVLEKATDKKKAEKVRPMPLLASLWMLTWYQWCAWYVYQPGLIEWIW